MGRCCFCQNGRSFRPVSHAPSSGCLQEGFQETQELGVVPWQSVRPPNRVCLLLEQWQTWQFRSCFLQADLVPYSACWTLDDRTSSIWFDLARDTSQISCTLGRWGCTATLRAGFPDWLASIHGLIQQSGKTPAYLLVVWRLWQPLVHGLVIITLCVLPAYPFTNTNCPRRWWFSETRQLVLWKVRHKHIIRPGLRRHDVDINFVIVQLLVHRDKHIGHLGLWHRCWRSATVIPLWAFSLPMASLPAESAIWLRNPDRQRFALSHGKLGLPLLAKTLPTGGPESSIFHLLG